MHRLHCICLVLFVLAGFASQAAPAFAISPVIVDCRAHPSRMTHQYTIAQLRAALSQLSATDIEYGDCYDLITTQLAKQLSSKGVSAHGKTSSNSGGSLLSVPLLIVLAVIVLGGGGFALSGLRRRGAGGGGSPPPAAGAA